MQTHTNATPIVLMDIFELSSAELKILAEECHPSLVKNISKTKRDAGLILSKLAGLPCGEDHQQPYDFVRIFPLSLSADMYESEEFEVIGFLFFLWAYKCRENLKAECFDDAMRLIKTMCVGIAYNFGAANKAIRRIELSEALDWVKWFRCTEGCFDKESGALADPDTAALRDFMMVRKWGQA